MRFTQDQIQDARSRGFLAGQLEERRRCFRRDMKYLAAGLGWGVVIGFLAAVALVITKIITIPS